MNRQVQSNNTSQGSGFERLDAQLRSALERGHRAAIVVLNFPDIDHARAEIGHESTDALLEEIEAEVTARGRTSDLVQALGPGKFLLHLAPIRHPAQVRLALERLADTLGKIFEAHGAAQAARLAAGAVMAPQHGYEAKKLLQHAEASAIRARDRGELLLLHVPDTGDVVSSHQAMAPRLARAIKWGELELHYQPTLCLRSGRIVGAEALMRWEDPELGSIPPDTFIAAAEATGQIFDLTQFALQNACNQLSKWNASLPQLKVAVNVTPSILTDDYFIDVLDNALSSGSAEPGQLGIEITENAIMEDRDAAHEVLLKLRNRGIGVSIDDFGTGYSSLAYLKQIPAEELKIDRSFVTGMLSDGGDHKIVEHSIRIGSSFGMSVVAEGVEDEQTLDRLRWLGCDYAQGYGICKPLDSADFEAFCLEKQTGD